MLINKSDMFENEMVLDGSIELHNATFCKLDKDGRLMMTQLGRCIRLNQTETLALLKKLQDGLINNTKIK